MTTPEDITTFIEGSVSDSTEIIPPRIALNNAKAQYADGDFQAAILMLSAVLYEAGLYTECRGLTQRALSLARDQEDVQTLMLRYYRSSVVYGEARVVPSMFRPCYESMAHPPEISAKRKSRRWTCISFMLPRWMQKTFSSNFRQYSSTKKFEKTIWTNSILNEETIDFGRNMLLGQKVEMEYNNYKLTGIVYPPSKVMKSMEPGLATVIAETNREESPRKLLAYLQKHWKKNRFGLKDSNDGDHWPLSELICQFWYHLLHEEKPASIIESLMPMFIRCTHTLSQNRTTIKCRIYSSFHNMLNELDVMLKQKPLKYDAMYIGDLTEKLGGYLTTMIHILPHLKRDKYAKSFVQCINTYRFDGGITGIISEYLNLPTLEDVEEVTGIKLRGYQPFDSELTTSADIPQNLYSVTKLRWGLTSTPKMPLKPRFKRWIFSIFVKIMKPPLQGAPLICQPHTTTTFLRLCSYLIQIRYIPQHWISEVLDTLLSGVISTPFLPVLKSPQPPEEASKNLSVYWLTLPRYEEDLARHMWGLVADYSQTMANAKNFEASFSSQMNAEKDKSESYRTLKPDL
ncbi:hypothetical protein BZA77DRAFT_293399 [Pyronema omphalodes]|nr:hypothetical protein BZA77DRAFT_293399 [Pyronema omphalodes]